MKVFKVLAHIAFSFLPAISQARQIKVAVIDTGIKPEYIKSAHLCPTGHKDLTGTSLDDNWGHGTNVSGLIEKYAEGNYCQIIIKWIAPEKKTLSIGSPVRDSVNLLAEAVEYATELNVDIINISAGGEDSLKDRRPGPDDVDRDREARAIKTALDKGIIVVAAAGNHGRDLNRECNFFPACHDTRSVIVGNARKEFLLFRDVIPVDKMPDKLIVRMSNRGKVVDVYEVGENAEGFGITMTGTSQATAIVTGKLVTEVLKRLLFRKTYKGILDTYTKGK